MSTPATKHVLVTGAHGFLGRHIVPVLEADPDFAVSTVDRDQYDLLQPGAADDMLSDLKPDIVLHLAGKVGGIIANRDYPADFFTENILINTLTFDAAQRANVDKLVTFIGGCSYPSTAASPITEDQMWEGYPQNESAAYSVAKKMLLVQSDSYRQQHGFNSAVLVPGNVYGEYDNFNPEYAHVIPALIRRFLEAKDSERDHVDCYGSGRPTRDFVYAGDVAKLVPWFIKNHDSSEPVNISSGTRTSIKELAEAVKELTGYEGDIVWDTSKPEGQMDKIFSVERLHALGLKCDTPLREGLRKTIDWFKTARETGLVRL